MRSRQEFCSFLLQSCAPKRTRAGQAGLSAVPHVFPARPRFLHFHVGRRCLFEGATALPVSPRSPGLASSTSPPINYGGCRVFFSKPRFEVGEPGSLLKGFSPTEPPTRLPKSEARLFTVDGTASDSGQ